MRTIAICSAAALLALSAAGVWGAPPAAPKEGSEGLTDGQIAAIVVAANQSEIDVGKLAESKATNPEVKSFAQRMVTDHTGVLNSAKGLHITPESNATSEKLQKQAEETIAHLKTLSGASFDRRYMDHEVYSHKTVLEEMDKRLIPGAKNADLKALLTKVRPAFEQHLEMAQKVQKEAEKGG